MALLGSLHPPGVPQVTPGPAAEGSSLSASQKEKRVPCLGSGWGLRQEGSGTLAWSGVGGALSMFLSQGSSFIPDFPLSAQIPTCLCWSICLPFLATSVPQLCQMDSPISHVLGCLSVPPPWSLSCLLSLLSLRETHSASCLHGPEGGRVAEVLPKCRWAGGLWEGGPAEAAVPGSQPGLPTPIGQTQQEAREEQPGWGRDKQDAHRTGRPPRVLVEP